MKNTAPASAIEPSISPDGEFAGAYSFEMIGDSMSPRYKPGDTIYVDPALPPKVGEDCVFWNQQQAIVGELIELSLEMWRIGQRPETIHEIILELPVREWPICHAVTGCHYG
jgi:hypothetical protein